MTERMPQRKSLASNGARRNAPRGVTRPRPEEAVQIAPENLVRKTIQLIENGTTFAQACGKMNISQAAWWRRVLHDPALKVELASLLMGTAWSRSDQFSAGGNAALVSVFAKFAKDTAASLAPQHFGEKVQVDSRQLVIHTNLDFSVCESLDGIVQGIATMAEVPLSPVEAQAEDIAASKRRECAKGHPRPPAEPENLPARD